MISPASGGPTARRSLRRCRRRRGSHRGRPSRTARRWRRATARCNPPYPTPMTIVNSDEHGEARAGDEPQQEAERHHREAHLHQPDRPEPAAERAESETADDARRADQADERRGESAVDAAVGRVRLDEDERDEQRERAEDRRDVDHDEAALTDDRPQHHRDRRRPTTGGRCAPRLASSSRPIPAIPITTYVVRHPCASISASEIGASTSVPAPMPATETPSAVVR